MAETSQLTKANSTVYEPRTDCFSQYYVYKVHNVHIAAKFRKELFD